MDHLNFTLFDHKETFQSDFKDEIKSLYQNNLDKINMEDGRGNFFLSFLETYFGFDALFQFVGNILYEIYKSEKYFYFGTERVSYKNHSLPAAENMERFIKVLEWYIYTDEKNDLKKEFLITLFRPGPVITQDSKREIIKPVAKYESAGKQLFSLAQALHSFDATNLEWIETMCFIAEKLMALPNYTANLDKIFGYSFYTNNTGKSKVGIGVPYREDEQRKVLLERVISEKKVSSLLLGYFEKCLAKVNKNIEDEIKADEAEVNW